eukprot:gene18601-22256_t
MIFEQFLYDATIKELELCPEIINTFGEGFKSKTFHRDREDEDKGNKRKNKNDPKDVKINFRIYGNNGTGMVRCRAKRLSVFTFEISNIRVKYGLRSIVVVDRDRKPPKSETTISRVFNMFRSRS